MNHNELAWKLARQLKDPTIDKGDNYMITAAFAKVARATLEEAAAKCEEIAALSNKWLADMGTDPYPPTALQCATAIRALSGDAPTHQEPTPQPEPKTTMTPDLTEFRRKITDKMSTLSLSLRDVEAVAGIDAATLCRFLSGKECSVTNFMKLGRWLEEEPAPDPALALARLFADNWKEIPLRMLVKAGLVTADHRAELTDLGRAALKLAGDGG